MKNIFSSFLLLLFSNLVFGQIEWVGNYAFSEYAADLVLTSQGQYILVHNGLTVFDSDGNVIFSGLNNDYPDWDGGVGFSEIVELPDSSIVLAAVWGECDIIIDIVIKFDKNWNQVWQTYSSFGAQAVALSDNSTIFSGYRLTRLLADGTKAWEYHPSDFTVNDMVAFPNDTILLATDIGLLTMNKDGDLLDSFPGIFLQKIKRLPNGNLLGQSNDTLYLYSPNFSQLGFFQVQGPTVKDVEFAQNEIAVLSSAANIQQFGLDLQPLGNVALAGQNQTYTSLVFAENGFALAGSERYGDSDNGNYSAFIQQVSMDGSAINTDEDAELTLVTQSGPLEIVNFNNWGLITITIPNIELVIKNNGSQPIERLNVNFSWPDASGFPCPFSNKFTKSFDNLNLPPGSTTNLTWGALSLRTWTDFSGEQIELCFWTSLPNHHLETNNDNDVACTQVTVAAKERIPVAFGQRFDPVADELHLELNEYFENEKTEALIFNAAGQLVHSETIATQQPTLELGHLADGTYFLQIISGQRVGWGKFAKY